MSLRKKKFLRDPEPGKIRPGTARGAEFEAPVDGLPPAPEPQSAVPPPAAPAAPVGDPNAGPAAASRLRGMGAAPRNGGNKPAALSSSADLRKAQKDALAAIGKEIKALEAKGDSISVADKNRLAELKKLKENPPQNPIALQEAMKKNGVESRELDKVTLADRKAEGEVKAVEAQAAANQAQADSLTKEDSPDNRSKLAQAEAAKKQGEAAMINAEVAKENAGSQRFSQYAQGASSIAQGAGQVAGVVNSFMQTAQQDRASIRQQVTQMEASKEQARTAEKQIRAQKEAARDKEGTDALAKARDNIGKEAQPGSNRANLLKSSNAGTHGTQDEGSMFANKGGGVGPDGKQKLAKRAQDDEMKVRELAQARQREDAERRSAKPQGTPV